MGPATGVLHPGEHRSFNDDQATLQVQIGALEERNRLLEQKLADTRMAALKGAAAADGLREAAEHEANALSFLQQALAEERLAVRALREAERAREEGGTAFLIDLDKLRDPS